jgi:hypothetical protein
MGRGDLVDFDLDDLGWMDLDDPLVAAGIAGTSCATTSTTIVVVLEEFDEFEPENGPIVHVGDPISSSCHEFDD